MDCFLVVTRRLQAGFNKYFFFFFSACHFQDLSLAMSSPFSTSDLRSALDSARLGSSLTGGSGESLLGVPRGDPPNPSSPSSIARLVSPVVWREEFCGGLIGQRGLVCSSSTCRVASHKRNPLKPLFAGDLLIPASGVSRCFCLPRIHANDFPDVVVEVLKEPRTPSDLRRVMTLALSTDVGDLIGLSSSEEVSEFFSSETRVAYTPRKLGEVLSKRKAPSFARRLSNVEEESESLLGEGDSSVDAALDTLEDTIRSLRDPASPGSEDPESFLISEWPKVKSSFNEMTSLLLKIRSAFSSSGNFLEEGTKSLLLEFDSRINDLGGMLGDFSVVDGASGEYGITVSSILEGLASVVENLKTDLGFPDDNVTPVTKRRRIHDRVEGLERSLQDDISPVLHYLLKEIQVVQTKGGPGGFSPPEVFNTDHKVSDHMDMLRVEVMDLVKDVSAMRDSVFKLEGNQEKATVGSKSFKIGGFEFPDLNKAKLFLSKVGPVGLKVGMYFDVFSLSALIAWSEKTMEEKAKQRSDLKKANLPTAPHELAVLFSFGCDRPPTVGLTKDITSLEIVLPKVKAYENWTDPTPFSVTVMSQYEKAEESAEKHLRALEFRSEREPILVDVVTLGKEMLQKTKKFNTDLDAQILAFRKVLLAEHLGATEAEAWALISEMLSAVYEEIYKARTTHGSEVVDEEDPLERASLALFGTFSAHEKMEEIRSSGFTKHPCVMPALSLHLFGRKASSSSIVSLKAQMKVLTEKVSKTEESNSKWIPRAEYDKFKTWAENKIKELAKKA